MTPEQLDHGMKNEFENLSSMRARHYDALCKQIADGNADEMDCIEALRDLCKDNERLAVLSKRKAGRVAELEAALASAEAARAETAAGAYEAAAERLEANRAHLNFQAMMALLKDEPLPEPVVKAVSELLDGIAAAIRALTTADAIAALKARDKRVREEALKVKPLVWEGDAETRLRADVYSVRPTYGQGPSKYVLARAGNVIGWFADPEPAKAAAQADYEARILSALIGGDA